MGKLRHNILAIDNIKISEIISDEIILKNVQDSLDLIANADCMGARNVILHEQNIDPSFFDLKSGLAGEILQKYVNYRIKLAIIGNFEKYNSKSLNAFIIECNRGSSIFFVDNIEIALRMITGIKN